MTLDNYTRLIYLQWQGALSAEERKELHAWLAESPDHQQVEKEIYQSLQLLNDYEPGFPVDVKGDYEQVKAQLHLSKATAPDQPTAKVRTLPSHRKWLGAAAAIAALLVTTAYFFWPQQPPSLEWAAIETKSGETHSITLSDGTQVWLNELSRFSYPVSFSGNNRPVKLEGEAYFKVAKNPDQPFEIGTPQSEVEVLGTSFNLRAYPNEPTTTLTVEDGRVLFTEKSKGSSVTLTQNEEAVIHHETQQVSTNKKADMNAMAWQTNHLRFKNRSLTEVFEIMERHFKVKINCSNPNLEKCNFTSPKEYNLDSLFSKLVKLYQIEVVSDGAEGYVVKGGGC
jgi:transmembrane sensor